MTSIRPYTNNESLASRGPSDLKQEDAAYFSELLSYSLERLSKEPELLKADQEHIKRQIEDTTVKRYRSFISTAQCLTDLREQLQVANSSLEAVVQDLPKLQTASEQFKQEAAAANAKRAENRLLYSKSYR